MINIQVNHLYRVAAERVFDAWLDTTSIRGWLTKSLREGGLPGTLDRVEIDARVGGEFCFSDHRGESLAIHWGEYLTLDRPNKIQFTWNAAMGQRPDHLEATPSVVLISIYPKGDECEAILVHEVEDKWVEYVSRVQASWSRMLGAIEFHC